MNRMSRVVLCVLLIVAMQSCSKKTQPSRTEMTSAAESKNDSPVAMARADSVVVKKTVVKRKPGTAIPKVITVNDQYAKKSVDGRLYYDLQGHRYWRSKKDGKYYLFNKSMLTDENFKKPN